MSFNYCERTSFALFDEPINAISNIAFMICGYYLIKNTKEKNSYLGYLIIFIGAGSFLFHLIPLPLFAFLDVFAIVLFIYFYNFCLCNKILKIKKLYSNLLSFLILIASFFIGKILSESFIGSSGFYLGLIIYMFLILFFLKKQALIKHFLFSTIIFTFSLFLRSMDFYLCEYFFSVGSHFLWHMLNALVLYRLTIFLNLTNGTSPKKPT